MVRYVFILLFLSYYTALSQNEASTWYFGENAGIKFNNTGLTVLLDGQLNTNEGCATISNNQGDLIFYTDGADVYNRNHSLIPNNGLLGSNSSTHSAIIVPKPLDPNIYYIFTVGDGGSGIISYSEFDINLDSGLGDINANKNIPISGPVNEKITAIVKDDGYWLVSHKYNSNEFISYSITGTGVGLTPIVSAVGSNTGVFNITGQIKISPDNSKIAVARGGETQFFDFNNSTGEVFNPRTINSGSLSSYGIEFSPNSNLLYLAYFGGVNQYNLLAGSESDIVNSAVNLVSLTNQGFASMQLAPNGSIYVARTNHAYIDSIENPNTIGSGCDYISNSVFLEGRECNLGLPTFIQSFFSLNIRVENQCYGSQTSFSIPDNLNNISSIEWNFGDPTSGPSNTSTDLNPTHLFSNPGEYTVSVNVTNNGQTTVSETTILISEQAIATQPLDLLICDSNNDGFYNFNLTNQDNSILNGLDTSVFSVNYYASLSDYNSNTPIATPNNYINLNTYNTQNIIASVVNNANNLCEASTSFNITVFEQPIPSQNIPTLEVCDNDSFGSDTDGIVLLDLTQNSSTVLNGQSPSDFTINYYSNATLTSLIPNPNSYQNTNSLETIYVEVINNNNTECKGLTEFKIKINTLPIVNPTVQLNQCDDDLDGFSAFNLNEVINEITTNTSTETITFHESLIGAEENTLPITNPNTYINQMVSTANVWARIENENGCIRTSQVNLNVSTTQIPLNFTRDFYQCDNGSNLYDGIASFDFSTVNNEILALFPVGQQLDIKYYKNQTDALAENDAITDISNYSNIGYPNLQNVFIRVDSALNNDCLGLGQHISLHVESVPLETPVISINQCDVGNDGLESIDTSNINTALLQGQTNVNIEFRNSNGGLLPNPLPNPLVSATQTIDVLLYNNNSLDPDETCSTQTRIEITVDPGVIAFPVSEQKGCDLNNDGIFEFDTSTIESAILNGQTGAQITYEDALGNSLSSPLPNPFVTSSQTVKATIVNPSNTLCFDQTDIVFSVNEQPIANTINNLFVCDDNSNDGEHVFVLNSFDNQILNGQSNSLFNISYHLLQIDADLGQNELPLNYLCTATSQILFGRIERINNSNCYDVTSFEIGVSFAPLANSVSDLTVCDDATNDETEFFDLSNQNIAILNGQSSTLNTITYHLSNNEALSNSNAINTVFENTSNPQTIYARIENTTNSSCFDITSFLIEVYELPVLTLNDVQTICENDSITLTADSGYDNYLWSTGEITNEIEVFNAGDYTVTVSNDYALDSCEATKTITVLESQIATIVEIETVDWSENNNSINIIVSGTGNYEFSLDGINYQDSNCFSNLKHTDYRIHVRDKDGCGIAEKDIFLLFYPKFFTPNNDGYNDYWQIYNSTQELDNQILIFDRYGKLIKQLSPTSKGWGGTYLGNDMPVNDYWFKVIRQNGKTYTGHFTLKR